MDISVSRLNNRMALQVPGELPLGLVFIVGRVESLGAPVDGAVRFELVDAGYRLRCRLPAAVAEETLLKEKDRVRASGHLAFDSHSAQYHLLARDIEVLAAHAPGREKAPRSAAQETAAQKATPGRPAAQPQTSADSLVPTELPPWVQKLAPPEVKEELGLIREGEATEPPSEMEATGAVEEGGPKSADTPVKLPPEMVAFLSSAIDSDEEIELTPEMIAEYLPEATRRKSAVRDSKAREGGIEEETEPLIEEGAGAAVDEVAGAGNWAEDGLSLPPGQTSGSSGKEEPENIGDDVVSPPQRTRQREERSQPGSIRQYVEYAIIVLLTLLIIVMLLIAVLLLQA